MVLGNRTGHARYAKVQDYTLRGQIGSGGSSGPSTSDDVTNESNVTGATVTDALNQLDSQSGGAVTSDSVGNDSVTVAGGTVTAAIDALKVDADAAQATADGNATIISGLGSDDIDNDSAVTGATVTNALTNVNVAASAALSTATTADGKADANTTAIGNLTITVVGNSTAISNLDSDDITNASTVVGTNTSDALETNAAAIGANTSAIAALDSDDIANASTVNLGAGSVSSALEANASAIAGLSSDDIANDSTLNGGAGTVTDALNAAGGGSGGPIGVYMYKTNRAPNAATGGAWSLGDSGSINFLGNNNTNWVPCRFVGNGTFSTVVGSGDVSKVGAVFRFQPGTYKAEWNTAMRLTETSTAAAADHYFYPRLDATGNINPPNLPGIDTAGNDPSKRITIDQTLGTREFTMNDVFTVTVANTAWVPYLWISSASGTNGLIEIEGGTLIFTRIA